MKNALEAAGFQHYELMDVHMFLDGPNGRPRDAVHLLFAGEKVKAEYSEAAPSLAEVDKHELHKLLAFEPLVIMKLTSFRLKESGAFSGHDRRWSHQSILDPTVADRAGATVAGAARQSQRLSRKRWVLDDFRPLLNRSLAAVAVCAVAVVICYEFVDRPVAFFVRAWDPAVRRVSLAHGAASAGAGLVATGARGPRGASGVRAVAAVALALFLACVSLIVADQFRASLGDLCGRYWPETWHDNNPSLIGTGAYGFHPFEVGDDIGSFPSGHAARIVGFCRYFGSLCRAAAGSTSSSPCRCSWPGGDGLPLRRRRDRRQCARCARRRVGRAA